MASDQEDTPTAVASGETIAAPGEPHFTPGAIIGRRYRIVSLLGEGGMGCVYRADDMKLGQRVALKFLPTRIASDPRSFERIRSEVRIGRQITHPNVCRIYDIVEVGDQHFISMELVDGEDLASLLRRIGRLPSDKALAIARDLAGGLSAAHARGVVHRDLKPANIMIDGEGNARIMDFGLAALSEELESRREIAGTPPYMAPEQFLGRDITQATDIYALGLILFEMFTGKRVFGGLSASEIRNAHAIEKTRPSSLVRDIDPVVERVILRCLEEAPEARPPSVQAVLASLPGGDPLREAVEAGQTPSPALVAAGGDRGDLPPGRAWMLLAGVIAAMLVTALLDHHWLLTGMVPDIRSRDAQRDRATEILDRFGFERSEHRVGWYRTNTAYLRWMLRHGGFRRDTLASSPPSAMMFVQRSSPVPLVAENRYRKVDGSTPAEDLVGMTTLMLDHTGRLRYFRAVPPERVDSSSAKFAWSVAFELAALDLREFTPADPLWTPPYGFDERAAWTGHYPKRPDLPIRIEAASRAGCPVYFHVVEPWDEPSRVSSAPGVGSYVFTFLAALSIIAGAVFARRNLARGRGDKRGALRLAIACGILMMSRLALSTHSSDLVKEWWIVSDMLMLALFRAVSIWLCYLAVEPFVRRQWPHMLISTSRLLAGRPRDPMVGRDVLIGGLAGGVAAAITSSKTAIGFWAGAVNLWPTNPLSHASMNSALGFVYILFGTAAFAIVATLTLLTCLVVYRLVLRSYLAAMIAGAISLTFVFYGGELSAVRIGLGLVSSVLLLVVLHKYGVLAFAVGYMYQEALLRGCLTFDLSEWYALRSMATLCFLTIVAVWAFHTSLGGKPALGRMALDEDAAA